MTAAKLDRLAQSLDQRPSLCAVNLVADQAESSLLHHFAHLSDPRATHTCRHRLTDVLLIALCAVLGGADSWDAIALFGHSKRDWFARFLELPNGIPSHHTFRRVFDRLAPQPLQRALVAWLHHLSETLGVKHIAIDGKTLRHSGGGASPLGRLHLVSAWATEAHLTLGQVAVKDKSNEITAIPLLLELLDLKGAWVTLDAMGCQKEIARQIVERGGDYVLMVKGNQERLRDDIVDCFVQAIETDFAGLNYEVLEEETKQGHGRSEKRVYTVIYDPQGLLGKQEWQDLKAIIMVYRERQVGKGEDESSQSEEVSYYIASSDEPVAELAAGIRAHWGIENKVHWILDVVFREDHSRVRAGHAAENLGWLRRVALALLKQDDGKDSIKCKRLKAGWDTDFLEKLLGLLDSHLLSGK